MSILCDCWEISGGKLKVVAPHFKAVGHWFVSATENTKSVLTEVVIVVALIVLIALRIKRA
jgi:hypothetical protein